MDIATLSWISQCGIEALAGREAAEAEVKEVMLLLRLLRCSQSDADWQSIEHSVAPPMSSAYLLLPTVGSGRHTTILCCPLLLLKALTCLNRHCLKATQPTLESGTCLEAVGTERSDVSSSFRVHPEGTTLASSRRRKIVCGPNLDPAQRCAPISDQAHRYPFGDTVILNPRSHQQRYQRS